ncbi:hypothetical protein CSQ88_19655 [Iodobacter sp. BJB302]|nr:hypothetical protein CSQ88_19655 [Iodobacter sp. BJB302]
MTFHCKKTMPQKYDIYKSVIFTFCKTAPQNGFSCQKLNDIRFGSTKKSGPEPAFSSIKPKSS